MNRREAIKGLAGMTIATTSCVAIRSGPEVQTRPEKLKPGQRWRDRDGWIAVLVRATHGPYWHVQWFHPNQDYPYTRDAVSAYRSWCDFEDWTYLGMVGDDGGGR